MEKKYQLFEEQCSDILDPARLTELELMKSMGLPTRLVNNFADMNEVCVCGLCDLCCVCV